MSSLVWLSIDIVVFCALLISMVLVVTPHTPKPKEEMKRVIIYLIIIPVFSLFMIWVFMPLILLWYE
ncbi:hypothetical protein [Shimazuella kribbensis]|uniref:hypothetical protein n=1 Tax=Shimazuella kribbensis TaxID=139808 RepID=UPI0004134D60|nr:hypothetical protein [Shimazuella kribbensis]